MDQLVIALDVDTRARALELADRLHGLAGAFKIGSRLFTSEGPALVAALVDRGERVFLDLKYHDIPSVVADAVRTAGDLRVWMLTVHASGGPDMLAAAAAARGASHRPLVVAVTVLTSLSEAALARVGVTRRLADQVETLADLAQQAGLDGVVASPWETPRLRARCGESFAIVTPGIRAGGEQARDDQARTLSAAEAVRAGATYIVVGRPIIRAPDPAAAARAICEELAAVRAGSRQRGAIGIRLCLYTRPRCHLCDEMKAVLDRVAARAAIEVQEVDISERTDLERAYGWDVPVLVRDGEILAKHRVTEDELMALLQRPNPRPLAPEP